MVALTATCFNYVLLPTAGANVTSAGSNTNVAALRRHGVIVGKQRKTRVRVELANAANSSFYPSSGGIPLATGVSNYGMVRNLDYVMHTGMGHTGTGLADSVMWNYSPTAHSMVGHWGEYPTAGGGPSQFQELPTTWSATLNTAVDVVFYFDAYGW
jgi:hypothetical protein